MYPNKSLLVKRLFIKNAPVVFGIWQFWDSGIRGLEELGAGSNILREISIIKLNKLLAYNTESRFWPMCLLTAGLAEEGVICVYLTNFQGT